MSLSIRETWYEAATEKGIVARFDLMEVYNVPASQEQGKEVFKQIPVVIIRAHNSGDFVPQKVPADPIARQKLIARFPKAWAAFQGENVQPVGTSLDQPFKGMTLGGQQRMKFEIAGVSTWEQVAELTDQSCDFVGFGTQRIRNETLVAMGRTPPGKPPNVQLMAGMNAEQALASMDGGPELVAELKRMKAEKDKSEDGGTTAATAPAAFDANSPAFIAAVSAAVAAALAQQQKPAAPAPRKRGGWPKGAKKGADGKPVIPDVELPADVEPAA